MADWNIFLKQNSFKNEILTVTDEYKNNIMLIAQMFETLFDTSKFSE